MATRNPVETGTTAIERTIASGFRLLRFPAALEARFEADTGLERARILVWRGLLGLALFNVFLISDWQLMPDRGHLADLLRAGVVTPLALAIMLLTWRNPPAVWREGLQAAIVVMANTVPPILILTSDSPLRESGHFGMLLVVMFATMVQRIRFWFVLAAVVCIAAMYFGTIAALPGLEPQEQVSFIMVFAGGVIFSLVASYALEREQRLTYLLRLRDSLRNEALLVMSRRDPLTGLGNRRALDAALHQLAGDAAEGEHIAVLLLDIDGFKAFNDSLGHQAGDECLRRVASLIVAELRDRGDLAFRYGGEEFLVLLRHADQPLALSVGERLRRSIERAGIPHPRAPGGVVTASVGAASTMVGAGIAPEELISGADAALYAAKRAGRNQVWPRGGRAEPAGVVAISRPR